MEERKKIIRELEDKKRANTEARNRLLEGLGETLLYRIGETAPFQDEAGEGPGGMLAEFRGLKREISESGDIIKSLEADTLRLKELEKIISTMEEEKKLLEKELEEVYIQLGKTLLENPDFEDITGLSKQHEENLLAKIEEQKNKLEDLEAQEGGIFKWLSRNAQTAVSRALFLKNQTALQKLYRSTGERLLSTAQADAVDEDGYKKVMELKSSLSSLATDLALKKGERRKMGDLFSAEGSPSRRIQVIEKHIAQIKEKFSGVYLRFGILAAESAGKKSGGKGALSSILTEEDDSVLEKAELLASHIAEAELSMEKIKTAISIDDGKIEIEKMKKSILSQQQKISAAANAIADLERQIAETEQHIEELTTFLKEDHGRKNKRSDKISKEPSKAGGEKGHSGKSGSGKDGAGDYFVFLTAQRMVEQLRSMAHGSVFSTITRQTFDAIRIAVPPEKLLQEFEQATRMWFDKILLNVKQSRILAQLRDTLLPMLISGEIQVLAP